MCRAFNTLGKHNGTYAKALLHGQGEVPENGDRGSEIQHVGTYGALQVEDLQPGIQGCEQSLRALPRYATASCIGFALQHHGLALCFRSSPTTQQCPTLCQASREYLCCSMKDREPA